jgi:hypothetical protein
LRLNEPKVAKNKNSTDVEYLFLAVTPPEAGRQGVVINFYYCSNEMRTIPIKNFSLCSKDITQLFLFNTGVRHPQ